MKLATKTYEVRFAYAGRERWFRAEADEVVAGGPTRELRLDGRLVAAWPAEIQIELREVEPTAPVSITPHPIPPTE